MCEEASTQKILVEGVMFQSQNEDDMSRANVAATARQLCTAVPQTGTRLACKLGSETER